MSIIRVEKNENYSTINNTGLNDCNLSFKAKGILAYLLSKPDNWRCQVNDLTKKSKDGRDSIYAGLRELRENGYMIKRPIKDSKNIITAWEEVLYETPQSEAKEIFKEQKMKNETAALKRAETIKKKKENPLPGNPYMDKPTSGKSVKGESVNGNAGNILNTNILNTDLLSTDLVVVVPTLIKSFEENICELKKSTKPKFIEYCENFSKEYIIAILDLCAESGIRSFAGFKTVIDTHINAKNDTPEKIRLAVQKYRQDRKNKNKKRVINNSKESTFNNFKQRSYDFKDLEKKLLGWN